MATKKHGRSKRKPADQRYKSERRWEKNKKRAIARDERRRKAKIAKLAKRSMTV